MGRHGKAKNIFHMQRFRSHSNNFFENMMDVEARHVSSVSSEYDLICTGAVKSAERRAIYEGEKENEDITGKKVNSDGCSKRIDTDTRQV